MLQEEGVGPLRSETAETAPLTPTGEGIMLFMVSDDEKLFTCITSVITWPVLRVMLAAGRLNEHLKSAVFAESVVTEIVFEKASDTYAVTVFEPPPQP